MAIGTSLSGMRSDGIAQKVLERGKLVVINLQQTNYDEKCHLRLYGDLQVIMEQLGKELGIKNVKRTCLHKPREWIK